MSKRIRLTPKSYSIPYVDVSPSKKHSLHRKTLPLDPDKTLSTAAVQSYSDSLSPCADRSTIRDRSSPVSFDFVGSSTDIRDQPLHSHSERQQKAADHWSEIRDRLVVEAAGFPYSGVECIMCEQPAIAVCYDCGSRAFFCDDHLQVIHSAKINIFHAPQVSKVGWESYTHYILCFFPEWVTPTIHFPAVTLYSYMASFVLFIHYTH